MKVVICFVLTLNGLFLVQLMWSWLVFSVAQVLLAKYCYRIIKEVNRLPTDRSTKENLYLLLWRMKINPALSYFIMQSENKICNSNLFFIEINWKEPQLIDRIITFLIKKYLKLFVILLWKKNNSKSFKTVWLICISNGILHLQKLSQLWLASSLSYLTY
jgi:hypothetical protein